MNRRVLIVSLCSIACAASAAAQSAEPGMMERKLVAELEARQLREVSPEPMLARTQLAVESKITTGRPYSAEATTEFVQVLGDGNRIARKTTVRIYRDGEGRTRREEVGPDGTVRSITIVDPVAEVSYVVDPATRTAHKSPLKLAYPALSAAGPAATEREAAAVAGKIAVGSPAEAGQVDDETKRRREVELMAQARGRGGLQTATRRPDGRNTESLGQTLIHGVLAEGSRTTTVIPAGAIGNEQQIVIVSEQWVSPDLEILLMTKHSDPRTGQTTYSLSNITRGEPRPGLFDVPADYTVQDLIYKLRTRTPGPV
jgi:hypothetical protein